MASFAVATNSGASKASIAMKRELVNPTRPGKPRPALNQCTCSDSVAIRNLTATKHAPRIRAGFSIIPPGQSTE